MAISSLGKSTPSLTSQPVAVSRFSYDPTVLKDRRATEEGGLDLAVEFEPVEGTPFGA